MIVISPGWKTGLSRQRKTIELPARRYNLPQNPISLHRVINRDLRKLERLIDDLITANSSRILKLQELLTS